MYTILVYKVYYYIHFYKGDVPEWLSAKEILFFLSEMILTVCIASACSSNADEEAKQSEESSEPVSAAITTEELRKKT